MFESCATYEICLENKKKYFFTNFRPFYLRFLKTPLHPKYINDLRSNFFFEVALKVWALHMHFDPIKSFSIGRRGTKLALIFGSANGLHVRAK